MIVFRLLFLLLLTRKTKALDVEDDLLLDPEPFLQCQEAEHGRIRTCAIRGDAHVGFGIALRVPLECNEVVPVEEIQIVTLCYD